MGTLLHFVLLLGLLAGGSLPFSGDRAYRDVQKLTSFGPRPPGSKAIAKAQDYIRSELRRSGLQVEEIDFFAQTPAGALPMKNIIGKRPGKRTQVVLLAGHYDTKLFREFPFVGANDGGSSAAVLLELARTLQSSSQFTLWFVFFDGEEAIREWSPTDSLYGSRHLAERLRSDGRLAWIRAMILVDLVGDRDLQVARESHSTPWLVSLLRESAERLGFGPHFFQREYAVEDDHIPFLRLGVPAVNLIDLEYAFWHTPEDTADKVSPRSLEMVGRVIASALPSIEK
ncbi:MAG: M28 family peptidase, partial [Acidobacteria bacterium]|nr:M28 family peptidase [Acidobacteriota bacterium]